MGTGWLSTALFTIWLLILAQVYLAFSWDGESEQIIGNFCRPEGENYSGGYSNIG